MRLNIGPLTIELSGVTEQEIPVNSRLFLDHKPATKEADRYYTRLLAVGNLNACYALYQERNERDANIYFIEGLKRELQTDTLFISCLCLERPLSVQGCYILHCTFLDYRGQAILFSGPSGIGKSTHANLWCRDGLYAVPAVAGTMNAARWRPLYSSNRHLITPSVPRQP